MACGRRILTTHFATTGLRAGVFRAPTLRTGTAVVCTHVRFSSTTTPLPPPSTPTAEVSDADDAAMAIARKISNTIGVLPPTPDRRIIARSERPLPLLLNSREAALTRKRLPKRTGVLARKCGMMSLFEADGTRVAVTVLEVDRAQVTHIKSVEKEGYFAVQVGVGARKATNLTRPVLGHLARKGVPPKAMIKEFRVRGEEGLLPVGTSIGVDHFTEGQYVDIKGKSKGKGYSGVMKRFHFKGLNASHGVSISHRSGGSTGQSQDPGRVLKFKKMSGRMGGENVTTNNVRVVRVLPEYGLLLVKGAVPGPKKAFVRVCDALRKPDVE
ncbi:mitochondrial 54S ribosomal protein uL3m [Limtongia smithiae]|uniref:mitochondrial 54S ribosomal protein uL3m n=1 Tax=Limtongia smithiae TaxID=1125753 RepID=UPI0034CDEB13